MTRLQHARNLKEKHNLPLTVEAIATRLQRGWSDARIIANPHHVIAKPLQSHPFKRKSFAKVAKRKGWDVEIR